jgi:hypothetical protein
MTLAMMGAMAVVAVVSVAVAALGALYAARTQTQAAADAAALAAAVATYPPASDRSPESAAAMMADRNGAVLVGCRCSTETSLATRTVEIITASVVDLPVFGEVEVRASGRAEFDPLRWLGR